MYSKLFDVVHVDHCLSSYVSIHCALLTPALLSSLEFVAILRLRGSDAAAGVGLLDPRRAGGG